MNENHKTALVLGGGGSTGNAWLIGVVAGLADAGLDVTTADLTIGTSAGATAVAQLAGATPAELFAATIVPVPSRAGSPMGDHLERFRQIIAASGDASDLRRRMGALALEGDDHSERWRAMVAARFNGEHWPKRRILITAVDAHTGEPIEFDRDSGVDLIDAVAASTSGGGSAYRIGDSSFIDGGYRRSSENADLAAGYERVLVLSPLGGKTLYPASWGAELSVQVAELRASGSKVEVVIPEDESLFVNAMDHSLRPAAAKSGYDQGVALAGHLEEFWR